MKPCFRYQKQKAGRICNKSRCKKNDAGCKYQQGVQQFLGRHHALLKTGTHPKHGLHTLQPRQISPCKAGGNDDDNCIESPNLTADFGYVRGGDLRERSAIGNLVWLDVNEDGTYQPDSEPGIGGVTVELWYDSNKNGIVDAGDIQGGTETTTAPAVQGGNYLFEGYYPTGGYLVRVTDANNVLGIEAGFC